VSTRILLSFKNMMVVSVFLAAALAQENRALRTSSSSHCKAVEKMARICEDETLRSYREDCPEVCKGTKKDIVWMCTANECRSAAAHIFSSVITQCFNAYQNRFNIDSVGAIEEDVYDQTATVELIKILKKKKDIFLEKAKSKVASKTNASVTMEEEDCWNRNFNSIIDNFRSKGPSTSIVCGVDKKVYAAAESVKKAFANQRPKVKQRIFETCSREGTMPRMELMKPGGIGDIAWHAKALVERIAFLGLLHSEPAGSFEEVLKKNGGSSPFDPTGPNSVIYQEKKLYIYDKQADLKPPKYGQHSKYYLLDARNATKQKETLKEEHIGFLWHDLVTPRDDQGTTGFDITHEFKPLIETVGKPDANWDIRGATMVDGMYTQDVFVRPKFFNHTRLEAYLTQTNRTALRDEIKKYREEITDNTYELLASQILEEVVFEKLTL